MKKTLLLSAFLLCMHTSVNSQITIFEDSFDTYTDFAIANVGSWTLTDVDLKMTYGFSGVTFPNSGVAKSFQVFNATTTVAPLAPTATSDWTARTGNKHMVCFAASTAPPVNNDWLISPQVSLGATGNTLTFWAKSCDATYGAEKFKVGISTTGTAPANFTIISPGAFVVTTPVVTWIQYTYSLQAYAGQSVYIGINCVSDDQFGFAVDDFKVTATTLNTADYFKNNFKIYPNPSADVISIQSNSESAITAIQISDINGRIVKTSTENNTTFSVREFSAGVYFLKVVTTDGVGTTKFIKK
jgi:hypothetical protein